MEVVLHLIGNSRQKLKHLSLALMLGAVAIMYSMPGFASSKVALVIGNADYESAPLKNPTNDANDMAKTLVDLGFQVMVYNNLDRNEMNTAIRDFGNKLTRAEIGLFYYAGHGMQVSGNNYLIPTGVDITSEDEVEFETIDTRRILAKMEWAKKPG